jgi:hypothetical protein
MNFFRRRKILKRMNSLDLTPVRLMEHTVRDDGNVSILLPRFQNRFSSALFQPSRKARLIPIRLDMTGSAIWLLIDGQRIVGEICRIMQEQHPEKMQPPSETEKRITEFLALLYRERYITFREISDKD